VIIGTRYGLTVGADGGQCHGRILQA